MLQIDFTEFLSSVCVAFAHCILKTTPRSKAGVVSGIPLLPKKATKATGERVTTRILIYGT